MPLSIGIDIGGTQIKGALFDVAGGECLDRKTTLTRDGERLNDVLAWAAGTLEIVSSVRAGSRRHAPSHRHRRTRTGRA